MHHWTEGTAPLLDSTKVDTFQLNIEGKHTHMKAGSMKRKAYRWVCKVSCADALRNALRLEGIIWHGLKRKLCELGHNHLTSSWNCGYRMYTCAKKTEGSSPIFFFSSSTFLPTRGLLRFFSWPSHPSRLFRLMQTGTHSKAKNISPQIA